MDVKQCKRAAREYIRSAKDEIDSADIQEDIDRGRIRSVYLGSIINPSGKYYTPFACSNVDNCHACKGSGKSKQVHTCENCMGSGARYVIEIARATNESLADCTARLESTNVKWLDDKHIEFECSSCDGAGYIYSDCRLCGGIGSREAYLDEVFFEELDAAASNAGGWIESGEGDPCDTFYCEAVTEQDDSSEE